MLIAWIGVERNSAFVHIDQIELLDVGKREWEPHGTTIDYIQFLQVFTLAYGFWYFDKTVSGDIEELEAFEVSHCGRELYQHIIRQVEEL